MTTEIHLCANFRTDNETKQGPIATESRHLVQVPRLTPNLPSARNLMSLFFLLSLQTLCQYEYPSNIERKDIITCMGPMVAQSLTMINTTHFTLPPSATMLRLAMTLRSSL